MTAMTNDVLSVRGLELAFSKKKPVLRGLDLALVPGQVTVLLGSNGAGKSTLLRVLLGVLRPDGGGAPPIASLWTEGRFEGDIARRTRELAESAALEFGAEAARGAPRDHLGSLLHLWAASVERAPWVADELAEQHLAWADAPLRRVAGGGGFYGRVAAATLSLLEELRGTRVGA